MNSVNKKRFTEKTSEFSTSFNTSVHHEDSCTEGFVRDPGTCAWFL